MKVEDLSLTPELAKLTRQVLVRAGAIRAAGAGANASAAAAAAAAHRARSARRGSMMLLYVDPCRSSLWACLGVRVSTAQPLS
jgi:hypothetical protein